MAGIREGEEKIRALPREVYEAVCAHADAVLVEADGSRGLPLKFPSAASRSSLQMQMRFWWSAV